jgi:hypothetical protein
VQRVTGHMKNTSRLPVLASVIVTSLATVLGARTAGAQQPAPPEVQPQVHPHLHVDVTSTKEPTLLEERVFVDESEGEMLLLPTQTRTARWEQVCIAPCSVDLDRYAAYRIGDLRGVPGTHAFTLPQGADATTLQVQAGDRMWHRLGGAMTGVGLAALVVGVSLVAAEHLFSDEEEARNAGFITGGAGILVLGAGIALSIATSTHVYSGGSKVALTPRGLVF